MGGGGASAGGSTGAPTGGSSGGSNPLPKGGDKAAAGSAETVLFRFYADSTPVALTALLEKVNGVSKVEADRKAGTVSVTCAADSKRLAALEAAAAGAGVPTALISHARVSLGLSARKGADPRKLLEEAGGVDGVRTVRLGQSSTLELCADLETLDVAALREAAERASFDLRPGSHEWVDLGIPAGDLAAMEKSLLGTRGILVVHASEGKLGLWTQRRVGDGILKKLAEKAGVAIETIERR